MRCGSVHPAGCGHGGLGVAEAIQSFLPGVEDLLLLVEEPLSGGFVCGDGQHLRPQHPVYRRQRRLVLARRLNVASFAHMFLGHPGALEDLLTSLVEVSGRGDGVR